MSVLLSMSSNLLLDEKSILSIVGRGGRNYRRICLPSGRVVWQPCPQLKALQYWVSDFLLEYGLQPLECATAYEPGSSIVKNARQHMNNKHILRMDISHFFNSINPRLIEDYLRKVDFNGPLSDDDINLIVTVASKDGGLAMGAPLSPMLANRVMIPVDSQIVESIADFGNKMTYTRYSDDLFVSSKNRIDEGLISIIDSNLQEFGFAINPGKTRLLGLGSNRMMAGVAVNADNNLSLGQNRKAELRKALYDFCITDNPSKWDALALQGFLAFAKTIEPTYVDRMLVKYAKFSNEAIMSKIARVTDAIR